MNPIHLAEQAVSNPWLFLAAALLLGAFHGLEPGHSKGIMTAFIIGTGGSYFQAVVLAMCATISHTAIVWILVWPASYGGAVWSGLAFSPYLNLISGVIVLALAYWMLRSFNRTNRGHAHSHHHDKRAHDHGHTHHHDEHAHDHGHSHHYDEHAHDHGHSHVQDHPHSSRPAVSGETLSVAIATEDDEHARYHMQQIAGMFSGQKISTAQVAIFGLSTGLAPCSAAIVILITCFRLHQPWLGFGLVVAFSLGLGLTLTSVALLASWGVNRVRARTRGFQQLASKAPFLSALVTAAIGIYWVIQFFRSY